VGQAAGLPPPVEQAAGLPLPVEQAAGLLSEGQAAGLSDTDEGQAGGLPYTSPPRSRRRPVIGWLVAAGLVMLALLATRLLADQNELPPETAAAPFTEQPIGDSRWLQGRPLAEARASMAVVSIGLEVYVIGGETAAGVVNTALQYETRTHEWRELAAKPTAVAEATAAVLFGEIYVPGGRLAGGQPTALVEAYSPSQNAWRPVAALPRPVAGGLALSDGSYLYLFGGQDGEEYLADSYVYDPGLDSWRPLPPMAQARALAAGGTVAGRLYVVGGFDDQEELRLCQFFEPASESWADCPEMLLGRGGAGAAVLVNKLYVIGGGLTGEVGYSEVYDPNGQTWHVVNVPMQVDEPAWTGLGVVSVETRLYAVGGRQRETRLAETYAYAPFVYQFFIPAAPGSGE
ncbi:MAG: kelch repeat-containing protein, partial [Chloroflexota bacterium]